LAELGLPENSKLIGLVSDLLLRNLVKDAIWAADLIKVIRNDVHLLIIGDGRNREQLQRFRDLVRIQDMVHFLGPHHNLHEILLHLDMLWCTSPYEDQSNVILRAMAAGVPVIAGNTVGTRSLIIDGETGFLTPLGNRAGYAGHAYALLENPDLGVMLGNAAKERVLQEFSVGNMISSHMELYHLTLSQRLAIAC
jgi:glycosyltransferase involved in cell wall biosynthesis